MFYDKVLVVGGGLAGLRAAIALSENNIQVAVLSMVHPLRSHSLAAQGGINAALQNNIHGVYDSWEKHAYDTIKGSDFLADQNAVITMVKEAPLRVREMEHWGCPFSRNELGLIAQRPFGGAGFPRTCFASDKTGHALLHTLYEQAIKHEIKFYDEWVVTRLVIEDGVCRGVVALELKSGELKAFQSEAVIFATGGCGRIYGNTTNSLISTALGIAIPYKEGVAIKDMEFVQFHPTTLYGTNILMTEGCRGEGGYLINNLRERFMSRYAIDYMELAPRDIVARAIQTEILEGRGFENAYVYLDLRHLGAEKIIKRLPGIRDICLDFAGIDPITTPIPVQPGQHYSMGGIDCNEDGETSIKGFFAAGECACISVHGANRLGGNSLLETIVFGARAGNKAMEYISNKKKTREGQSALEATLKDEEKRIENMFNRQGAELPIKLREELGKIMQEKVGIFRKEEEMKEALEKIKELQERIKKVKPNYSGKEFNWPLVWELVLESNLMIAEVITLGALNRTESRGSHFRRDYPKRDDINWLKHTLANYTPEEPKLSYKDVDTSHFKPVERRY